MSATYSLETIEGSRRLRFVNGLRSHDLHPIWLRERTTEIDTIDVGSMQRLYDPASLPADLVAEVLVPNGVTTKVTWSDGHVQVVDHHTLAMELGWVENSGELPAALGWSAEPTPFPRVAWPEEGDNDALVDALDSFWVSGFVVFTGTPTKPGSLEAIASRFGWIRGTNFGMLFDVFSKPNPVDLAYTPIELKAHTDNPYRRPVPSIQFLHCLVNDATGGESTLVDGLAAFEDFAAIDPEGHRALTGTMVSYRYHYAEERLVDRSPILETDADGTFAGIRNSDRLDFVDPVDPNTLDIFYRGRAGLRSLLNDPARRATFLLSPGDVMMMNNRRLLHGRNSYELESGVRHLQGCYIDLDGPDMLRRRLSL